MNAASHRHVTQSEKILAEMVLRQAEITRATDSTPACLILLKKRVYPKVSGMATWSENCKWYSSLPLGAIVSLFCESD
jgi:hypothetical protein